MMKIYITYVSEVNEHVLAKLPEMLEFFTSTLTYEVKKF
jgi:hypothetical protein